MLPWAIKQWLFCHHNSINDLINRALKSAEIPSILDPPGCVREDGKRPDGMTLVPWKNERCLLWDFTCIDTFAPSYISSTSICAGAAAEGAEIRKRKRYSDLVNRFIFIPVAIESSGVWGKEGHQLMNLIGRRITEITGEKNATIYLFQRISVALQRGNTASILGCLPSGKDLSEIYYI